MNYNRIGDYIELVDERNTDLKVDVLLGLSISKQFIPSVANTIGTNMKNYKIIRKNQFACSVMQVRRDGKMPVALLKNYEEAIISQAYPVFQVINEEELLPDYLMMWFSRCEFDRQATFHAVGGVRGSLEWEDFLDFELPIPSIEKQQQIVAEYNTVTNRIELNEKINTNLEATAQALYKHWFVDFEFPIGLCHSEPVEDPNCHLEHVTSSTSPRAQSRGERREVSLETLNKIDFTKGYKSSGGKMVYNEELDKEIPVGWSVERLGGIINYTKGYAFKSDDYKIKGYPVVRVSDLTKRSIDFSNCYYIDEMLAMDSKKYEIKKNDLIITSVGSWASNPDSVVGKVVKAPFLENNAYLNQNMVKIRCVYDNSQLVLYNALITKDFSNYTISGAQGSANQASVTLNHLFNYFICFPNEILLTELSKKFNTLNNYQLNIQSNLIKLKELQSLLLAKMTRGVTKSVV